MNAEVILFSFYNIENDYEPQDRGSYVVDGNLTCFCSHVMSDLGSEGCLPFGTKIPRSETSHYLPNTDCVTERACENCPFSRVYLICPYQDNDIWANEEIEFAEQIYITN